MLMVVIGETTSVFVVEIDDLLNFKAVNKLMLFAEVISKFLGDIFVVLYTSMLCLIDGSLFSKLVFSRKDEWCKKTMNAYVLKNIIWNVLYEIDSGNCNLADSFLQSISILCFDS